MSKCAFQFSAFTEQVERNGLRNAFRFDNQNLTWTYDEFETHSNAFAYGLVEQGWKSGDKLAMLLGKSNTSEAAAVFVGAAKAGVEVVPMRPSDISQLEQGLSKANPKGIVFSPNAKFGEGRMMDAINTLIPEAADTKAGEML
jgi:acyl-CoA synthetase (AMP-forming)/AMP-acid ligase II